MGRIIYKCFTRRFRGSQALSKLSVLRLQPAEKNQSTNDESGTPDAAVHQMVNAREVAQRNAEHSIAIGWCD